MIAARFAIPLLFTGLSFVEGIFLFGTAVHGWPWFVPLSALFVIAAAVHIWFVAWQRAPDRASLKRVSGIGFAMGLVPFAAFLFVYFVLRL